MGTTKDERPERDQTDESLALERSKADDALKEQAAVEKKADGVIERARDEADEVLTTARARADQRHDFTQRTQAIVDQERGVEDELIENERASADSTLRDERAASARLLARMLPLERDKTDRYLLTERARSDVALANRDDFLGMVSHDLRDLLNGIVLNAEVIATSSQESAENKGNIQRAQRIQRSSARMARLIADLVDIASIDAGKLAVVPTVVDACGVVQEAVDTWGPPAASKGITLRSVAEGTLLGRLDHERILQVLGNLITNALKFTPKGGTLVVGVTAEAGEVRFSVKDSGAGIPADKLEMIFERFWQVGVNDRRGLGLGLYISRCLVEAQGGKIWVESTLGAGSTFFFTAPAAT